VAAGILFIRFINFIKILFYLIRKDKKISTNTIKRVAIVILAISSIAAIIGGTIYLNSGYASTDIFKSLICIGIFLISGSLIGLVTEII
jgi:hypothetical protein